MVVNVLGAKEYVVKAQILAGGRGKGHFDTGFKGGVHLCNTCENIVCFIELVNLCRPSEAGELVEKMIGHKLITHQTPPSGVPVNTVRNLLSNITNNGASDVY